MNFTQEVKRDLVKRVPRSRCCKLALLSAALETCGETRREDGVPGFSFTGESEGSAAFLIDLVRQCFGVHLNVTEAGYDARRGRDKLTFSYFGERAEEILSELGGSGLESPLKDCCARAYLKGAFLFGGSCTLPRPGTKTGYHLEIVFDRARSAESFVDLLDRLQLIGNVVVRGEKFVVYLKSREAISDFLATVGANGALRTLEAVTAEREENNRVNRVENCSAGNADRAAIASAAQVVAIGALEARGKLPALGKALGEVAKARLEHPEYSLSELAAELGIGKSCLNHRLRKLMEICKEEE